MICLTYILFYAAAILLGIVLLFRLYIIIITRWCSSKVCLVGKTIIVTGANTGIGYEAALEFAKRGARVILACRDEKKSIKAKAAIVNETKNTNIVCKHLDLTSLASVRDFAECIAVNEEKLDVLVNNAGIGGTRDTPEEGAQTTIHAAIHQGIEPYTGCHFVECAVVRTYSTARDPTLPKKLWDKTVELLKCEEEVKQL